MPTGEVGHPGESPREQAARLLPRDHVETWLETYRTDLVVQRLGGAALAKIDTAIGAIVEAQQAFAELRGAVVDRTQNEIRDARPQETKVGDTVEVPREPQGE